jgi:hypothetical protein
VTPETDALSAVARSVTGPDTPNAAAVSARAPRGAVWALILAGPALSAMLCAGVWVLAWVIWPDVFTWRSEALGKLVIVGISSVCMMTAATLGIVVFRLASGGLKSVKASAGPGSLEIRTGEDETP